MKNMKESLSLDNAAKAGEFAAARGITAEDIRNALGMWRKKLSEQEQQFAIAGMERHLKSFAPQWLTELENLSAALELPERSLLELQSYAHLVPEKLDCTSWIVTPELTASKKMILHKNRDSAYSSHGPLFFSAEGKFSWLGSCGRIMPSPLMGINEKGLAVAMNSGEKCAKWNSTGFGTPMMARMVLENCSTPDEAAKMIEELRREGAYSHNNRGSIFFYANSEYAGLTELCAERSQYINFDFGYMIRANVWHLPGMVAMSEQSSQFIMDYNLIREYMVRDGLREHIAAGGITAQHCLEITRRRGRMLPAGQIPVCRPTTIASGTFEINGRYPELNTFYHLSGPARNTIAVPVFAGAGALPAELVSCEWTEKSALFKERRGMDHVLLPDIEKVEQELITLHAAAEKQAEKLLAAEKRCEAVKFMQEHTRWLFEIAAANFSEITGIR